MQRRDVQVSWTSFLLAFTLLLHGFQNGSSLAISRSIPEEKKLAINSRKQRSTAMDEDQTLIKDLEELLELKKEINRMREASEAPGLDSRSKYLHLQDLQSLLERLKTLKEQVEANNGGAGATTTKNGGRKPPTQNTYSESPDLVHFCDLQLVETVPDVLEEKDLSHQLTSKSIFETWLGLFGNARSEVKVMSQWAIDGVGRSLDIFNQMKNAAERGVKLSLLFTAHDTAKMDSGFAPYDLINHQLKDGQVMAGRPNISGLINPKHYGNIIHSKVIIVDNQDLYLGSGNLGSRCTTRTKEIGMLASKCPSLAMDASKVWNIYKYIDEKKSLPHNYPLDWETVYNSRVPMKILNNLDGTTYKVYVGSSPKRFCTNGRNDDLSAILDTIDKAEEFIHISVGEYVPAALYTEEKHRWDIINRHLEQAVLKRHVEIKFLFNEHATHMDMLKKYIKRFVKDLKDSWRHADIKIKLYTSKIDKHRFHGSHAKFMVTEKAGYIGSSNWAEDYFTDTAGMCIVFEPDTSVKPVGKSKAKNLVQQMEDIFQRDWKSSLSKYLL